MPIFFAKSAVVAVPSAINKPSERYVDFSVTIALSFSVPLSSIILYLTHFIPSGTFSGSFLPFVKRVISLEKFIKCSASDRAY